MPKQDGTSSTKTAVSIDAVEALFSAFAAMYGARLSQMWKGVDILEVKVTWAEALSGYKVGEVKAGLAACKAKPWPPTLPEFLTLCRPETNYEQAYEYAQAQMSRRENGKDVWPNKALFWAAVEFGSYDLKSTSWQQAKIRWTRILCEKSAIEDELHSVPPFREQLVAPGKTLTNRDTAIAHLEQIKSILRKCKLQKVVRV